MYYYTYIFVLYSFSLGSYMYFVWKMLFSAYVTRWRECQCVTSITDDWYSLNLNMTYVFYYLMIDNDNQCENSIKNNK